MCLVNKRGRRAGEGGRGEENSRGEVGGVGVRAPGGGGWSGGEGHRVLGFLKCEQ